MTNKRLESLDVLRGMDMFLIFLADPVPCIFVTTLALFGLGDSALAKQFDHVSGAGLHVYDVVFPLFLFISGVTIPFSCAGKLAKGLSRGRLAWGMVRRALTLFVLGMMLWTVIDGTLERNILSFDWKHFRVWSVIGRIGLAWGGAALLYLFCKARTRYVVCAAILVGMGAVLRFAVAPGAPAGVNPLVNMRYLWVSWVDVNFLTTAHRGEGGFVTVTMIATAMLGAFAGEILMRKDLSPAGRLARLFSAAVGLAVVGLLMAFACGDYSIPIHKGLWTPSFVLVVGGISMTLLGALHWIVDVRGWRRWGFFFKVIGMNAITIYLLNRTVFNWGFESEYFFGGICRLLSPEWGAFVSQAGMIAIGWLFLYWLYKNNHFLRV